MKKLSDNQFAELYGHITLLNEEKTAAAESLASALERIAHLENQIRFLEERLKNLTAPKELLTEKEAAELLRVSLRTMHNWRNEKLARIPFILTEGGDVRYRV